jgi:hypothetical protein
LLLTPSPNCEKFNRSTINSKGRTMANEVLNLGGERVEDTHLLVAGLAMQEVTHPQMNYYGDLPVGGPVVLEAVVSGPQTGGNSKPKTGTASGGGGNKPS